MKIDNDLNWDLITKYLSNETSETENNEVKKWINTSKENKEEFSQLKNTWETVGLVDVDNEINVVKALQKVKLKIKRESNIIKINRLVRIAAAIIIASIIGISLYYFNSSKNTWIEIASGKQQDIVKTLPDGSVIYLNANSILKYPENFKDNERNIKLKGEAFFKVEPDKSRPFIITSEQSKIKVLGTSFNVRSYSSCENTIVAVSTGKVEFSKTNAFGFEIKKVMLEKGHKGVIDKTNNELKSEIIKDKNYLAWRTKMISFNQTPLFEVKQVLESVYQVPIKFENEELKSLPLTADFNNNNIQYVVKIIEKTFSIVSKFEDGKIIFAKKKLP